MRLSLGVLVASFTAALAAPAPEAEPNTIERRAPSCNIVSDACYISCAGGSAYLNCYGSYCVATGTAGNYGYCKCKCRYG
ncbi:hypothetical protein SAPIO_CDS7428 [Scedosporium apiospermum]|uniref:Invertebrate defensins family profile domain-containing protein n=1 Tax=Pseudallescheria apiosperma TaxID=563466 RepID=A0A084G1W1_PSEDA|nr:uncharacterized protein SAPIO_CDS7428 [Scedosporium apiospermum]KEZ41323.1 hypothetical protein SAPIO_CDS7428 [Scedosporium apiospermum]